MRILVRLLALLALSVPAPAMALDPGKVPPITLGTGSAGDASTLGVTANGVTQTLGTVLGTVQSHTTGIANNASAISGESTRAKAAEAGLLPRGGGTLTGGIACAAGSTCDVSGMAALLPASGAVYRPFAQRFKDVIHLADFGSVTGCSTPACIGANATALTNAMAAMPFGGDIYLGRDQLDLPTGLVIGNTTGSAYRLIGDGAAALFVNGATGNFMKLNPGSQVLGVQVAHRDTRTGGMDFDLTQGNTIRDITTSGYFVFIGSTSATKTSPVGLANVTKIIARAPASGAGSGLIDLPYQHGGRFMDIAATGLVNVAGPDFCIHLRSGDTAEIDHVNCAAHGTGLFANPGSGEFISFVTVANSYFDSARGTSSLKLQPASGGSIIQWTFSNTEIGNAGQFNSGPVQTSALLDGSSGGAIDDIDFSTVKFPGVISNGSFDPQGQAFAGLYAVGVANAGNVKNIRIVGGSSTNAQSGLRFNNVIRFSVTNHTAGSSGAAPGNTYGVYIEGTSDKYIVSNNILLGNTTAPLIEPSSGVTSKINTPNITN